MLSLRHWFGRRQVPVLGIDIGAGGIRIVELGQASSGLRILHYAHEPMPHPLQRDGSLAPSEEVVAALRRALRKSGTRLRTAALALPSGSVIKKTLTLPTPRFEEELEMQVEAEASQSLPFPMEEISLDFGNLGPSPNHPDSTDVLLVAARKDRIEERVALAEAAGMKALIIDVESHALMSAVAMMDGRRVQPPAETDQPVLVLQLAAEGNHCYFMHQGAMLFEHELGLSLPKKDAKRDATASVAAMTVFQESLCQELSRALQLFSTSGLHAPVTRLYLVGADAMASELVGCLQSRLSLSVSVPDPFAELDGAQAIAQADASAYLLACGLAMRSFYG